jgi:hypothetical protein
MDESPFELIKVKRPVPSDIRSVQAAIKFVKLHVSEAKQKELHWSMAISALDAAAGGGSFAHARAAMHHALATEGWLTD